MYERLGRALLDYDRQDGSWEYLIHQAEHHGVAPLLHKHLSHVDLTLPNCCRRILGSLHQRTRLSNQIRIHCASDIINHFQRLNIDVLAIKGIALCNYVYDDPSWRSMRDIDLLIGPQDLDKAERCLVDCGYRQDRFHTIPEDYYHLPPLVKTVEQLPISVELHHQLLPLDGNYPLWPLEKSYDTAMTIAIGETETATLGLEDNLRYLYLHGLRAPLSYEPFRFVHIADLISLVERYSAKIDWRAAQEEFPQLFPVLSRLHFVTPWPDEILNRLGLDIGSEPKRSGEPYCGWPLVKFNDVSASLIPLLVKDTIWPPQWWTQIHYGRISGSGYFKVRLLEHPRSVWRWLKGSFRQRNNRRA